LGAGLFPQAERKEQCLGECSRKCHAGSFAVGHHEAERVAPGRAYEGTIEGLHAVLAARERIGVQLLNFGPDLNGSGRRWHGLAEADGTGIREDEIRA